MISSQAALRITQLAMSFLSSTLVDTVLLGALFVLICDMIVRSVIMPYELPIDLIVMSVAATFVYSYMFQKTGSNVLYVLLIRHYAFFFLWKLSGFR